MVRAPLLICAFATALALLTACGGGGTPSAENNPVNPGTIPPSTQDPEQSPDSEQSEDQTDPPPTNGDDDGGDAPGTTPGVTGTTEPAPDPTPVNPGTTTTSVTLASLCTPSDCRGVFWSGKAGDLDLDAVIRPNNEPFDNDGDPETPNVIPTPYQFQASYTIPAGNLETVEEKIALIDQDVRYAQATVDAVADLVGLIRTGREGEDLTGADDYGNNQWWSVAAEVRSLIRQNKVGAPVSEFSATLPLTEVNPVAQIIAARGVSHDLRGAADEDVATIDTLLTMIAAYEQKAMDAKAAIDARWRAVEDQAAPIRALIATSEGILAGLMSELSSLESQLSGLETEFNNIKGELDKLTDSNPETNPDFTVFDTSCSDEGTCRTRLGNLGRFDTDGTTIIGGLVGDKRAELDPKRAEIAATQTRLRNRRTRLPPLDALIQRLGTSQVEIQYYLDLIAAAESAVFAQQTADKAALAALPADIESTKAAAIRTALEGIINETGATDPANARFDRDGILADLATAGDAVFARNPNAESASPPATYADYGMWLEGTDAAPVLRTRMGLVDPGGAAPGSGDLTTPGSATYNGTAHGLSARTTTAGETRVTASGHFTAAVRLNATFGDAPMIGGTVTNFQGVSGQGNAHVGSDWRIDLRATDASTGNILNGSFDPGTGTGHPTDGGWSAYAYGTSGEPPIGVYGGFEADFTDGAAIGQFDAQ